MLTLIADVFSKVYSTPVVYRPLNDLEIRGRKIGGYGSFTVGDARTFYGFFQAKVPDYEVMEKVLLTPPEKVADKITKTAIERAAYLEEDIGKEVPWETIKEAVCKGFEEHFNMKLVPGELTDYEKELIERDWSEISSEEWILANTDERRLGPMPPGAKRCENVAKVSGGPALRIVAYIKDNKIQNISITGSIHCDPPPMIWWMEDALRGVPIDESIIRAKIEEVFTKGTVAMGTADDFVRAVMGAVAG
jgi:lipoate-protein ligase A